MSERRIDLPKTLKECHVLIIELRARVEELEQEVAQLRRQLYGSRRERFVGQAPPSEEPQPPSPGEPGAPQATADADHSSIQGQIPPASDPFEHSPLGDPESSAAASAVAPSSPSPRRTSSGRRPRTYDPNTPREKVYHPLDESSVPPEILHHPRARRFFRFVREEVELPERRLRVIEHYQEVIVVDDATATESVLQVAPVPEPLLDRCYAGPSLLAYLAVSRFADHIPYYREEDILRRSGLSIHRSTQWRWMRGLAKLLTPLVRRIRERVLCSRVLGIDETPCPILCPESAGTRSAYLYAQYGDDTQPYVAYHFASHKTRQKVQALLQGFRGVLQSDAYICYELIAEASLEAIQPASCWAHARRKFEPLVSYGRHPQASWILEQIQRLYDIEDRGRALSSAARHALRQIESRPIVARIQTWLEERDREELPRSLLREGVSYLRNRWESFTRFLEDAAIPLDNNRTEGAIKGPVMGKKAWLFFGHENAGETAATLYTLMMSCKRHHIDPHAYLVDVFRRIKSTAPEDLDSLLPDRWIADHPQARVQQRVRESHAASYRKRTRRAQRRARALLR